MRTFPHGDGLVLQVSFLERAGHELVSGLPSMAHNLSIKHTHSLPVRLSHL